MHFVVAPLAPISNNYTVRIGSHGSRDPDRSEAGRSWRRVDTAAASASRLQANEQVTTMCPYTSKWSISGQLTRHQILQIQLLLLLTLVAQADSRAGQQNGSQETGANACPGHNVRPIIGHLSIIAQHLEEHTSVKYSKECERDRDLVTHRVPLLVVILANDFLLLKELDRMPETHCTSGQQAGN